MSEYDEGKGVHISRFREDIIEVKLKYFNGRKCLWKKVLRFFAKVSSAKCP